MEGEDSIEGGVKFVSCRFGEIELDAQFTADSMFEVLPAHRKYIILEMENRMCKFLILPL